MLFGRYFFLTFWVKAEPATDFTAFEVDFDFNNLLALVATFALVVSLFFAIKAVLLHDVTNMHRVAP